MTDTNLFEWATKNKVRFETERGSLTIEDVWALPLKKNNGVTLDSVAKSLYRELKESQDESFVVETSTTNKTTERKLELVKYIISVRLDEQKAREERVKMKEQDETIRTLLKEKELEDLRNKSPEELREMLKTSN